MFALIFALLLALSHPAAAPVQTGCPHLPRCHPPVTQSAPCQGPSHQAACYLPRRPATRP